MQDNILVQLFISFSSFQKLLFAQFILGIIIDENALYMQKTAPKKGCYFFAFLFGNMCENTFVRSCIYSFSADNFGTKSKFHHHLMLPELAVCRNKLRTLRR